MAGSENFRLGAGQSKFRASQCANPYLVNFAQEFQFLTNLWLKVKKNDFKTS